MTLESSLPRHPMELPRILNFREYGFDNLDEIVKFSSKQIEESESKSFSKTFENDKKFMLFSAVYYSKLPKPYHEVELEVGFIDFQDQEKVLDTAVIFRIYEQNKHFVLILAKDTTGKPTPEIEYALTQITNGDYLKLASAAA